MGNIKCWGTKWKTKEAVEELWVMLLPVIIHTHTLPLGQIFMSCGGTRAEIHIFRNCTPVTQTTLLDQQTVHRCYVLTSASSPAAGQIQSRQEHAVPLLSSPCFKKQEETCYVSEQKGSWRPDFSSFSPPSPNSAVSQLAGLAGTEKSHN